MDTTQKKWFVHVGGKQQGPFTLEEVRARTTQKEVTPETPVWCEGMAAWAAAKTVSELQMLFVARPAPAYSSPSHDVSELSALIEIRPNDVDDRTAAIDARNLKQAKKEAAQVHKVAQKAEKSFVALNPGMSKRSGGMGWVLVVFPLIVLAVAVGGFAAGMIPTRVFGPQIQVVLEKLFSPIPALDDVKAEEYIQLRTAAGASLSKGARLAVAVSVQSMDKPVFYVAGNLPEGTNLIFTLRSKPGTAPVLIRFPLALSKKMGKTRSIHTMEGESLPQGEYYAIVVEDDEQLPAVRSVLAALPSVGGQLPNDLPQNRKAVGVGRFYLGSKLSQPQGGSKDKAMAEFRMAQQTAGQVKQQAIDTFEAGKRLASAGKAGKRSWDDFHRKWVAKDAEPRERGYYYSGIFQLSHDLWQASAKLHELQNAASGGSRDPKQVSQIGEWTNRTGQKLNELSGRLDQAARAQSNPQFVPAAGQF